MKDTVKWRVLFGGFFSYTFDAMDILLLAMCLQAIMADLHLAPAAAGMLATSTMIGVALSAVIMGWFSDNYGRRAALLVSLVSFSILTMAIALTTTYWEILVLRFLAGLGLGGLWGVISAYISETWPIHQRGRAAAFALSSFRLVLRWPLTSPVTSFPPTVGGRCSVRRPSFAGRALRSFLRSGIRGLESSARKAQQGRRTRSQEARSSDARRDLHQGLGEEHDPRRACGWPVALRLLGYDDLAANVPRQGTRTVRQRYGNVHDGAQRRHVLWLPAVRLAGGRYRQA